MFRSLVNLIATSRGRRWWLRRQQLIANNYQLIIIAELMGTGIVRS
jgi:hypothetical protein